MKLASPPYVAVIECLPTERVAMARVARPFDTAPLPRDCEPSKNVTVPVAAVFEIVAVKVTVCPRLEGSGLEVTVVVVFALFTT